MRPYPHRVALAPRTPGRGFNKVRGGNTPGDNPFRPRIFGVVVVWKDIFSDPGMVSYLRLMALALRPQGWGFFIVGCGIYTGSTVFIFGLGVVDVHKHF